MDHAIAPGLIPARPGLEKEEPELAHEDDIPADDRKSGSPEGNEGSTQERPLREVERE